MRWGVHTFEDYEPATGGPLPDLYDRLIARAVLAEELGYEGFWVTEHHFHWFGGAHANPLVALSAIAARTTRLRLGTAVTLLPYRHPLLVAEEFACLDNLSHGRVDFGVGRGFIKIEYDGLGVPMAESRPRFDESLEVIRRAWTEPEVTHKGGVWRFEETELVPKPVQKPHPPIWVGATVTPESFANVGTLGLALMIVPYVAPGLEALRDKVRLYLDAFRRAGHRHEPQVLAFFMVHLVDDMADLGARLARPLAAFATASEQTDRKMRGERDPVQYAHFGKRVDKHALYGYDAMQAGRKALLGTPRHCAEIVTRWAREVGVTYTSIMPSWGGLPEPAVQDSLRRFAREVIPLVEG